ncbi:MAG: ABC transporter ATP-binding protein [Actinomycetota bacterium]
MSSLTFDQVSVHYGAACAVRSFSETVRPGEWLCLIGPNGAGKSSLLRSVAGLTPHTGNILVDGSPLHLRSGRRRAALVAHIPQTPVLPDTMTVEEYVVLGRNPYVSYFGQESRHDRAIADDVLRRLDLGSFADRRLGTMSGGERQRVVIARAMVQEAPIMLLDEPTSALDIGHQQYALELLDALRRDHGLTIVSAMHDLTLAGLYSDRLALLHHGHCVASGPAEDVLRADTLSEFYGVTVNVHRDDDGTVVIVPRRTTPLA